jgi:phosphopantetheine adenylyltransferase
MSHSKWSFISSTLIKEIVQLGGDVARFVPPPVAERLRNSR